MLQRQSAVSGATARSIRRRLTRSRSMEVKSRILLHSSCLAPLRGYPCPAEAKRSAARPTFDDDRAWKIQCPKIRHSEAGNTTNPRCVLTRWYIVAASHEARAKHDELHHMPVLEDHVVVTSHDIHCQPFKNHVRQIFAFVRISTFVESKTIQVHLWSK